MEDIALDTIDLGDRARVHYDGIGELWKTIEEQGLIHPIAVWDKGDGTFLLLAGGRRYMAHVFGKAATIAARIYEGELDELDQKIIEQVENLQRSNLGWMEEAALKEKIHHLMQEKHGVALPGSTSGHTLTDTARLLGESRALVSEDIKLAKAARERPEIAKVADKSAAKRLLKRTLQQELSAAAMKKHKEELAKGGGDPAREALLNSYIVGDFFEHAKQIPDNSFNMVECDPPYAIDLHATRARTQDSATLDDYNEVESEDYPAFIDRLTHECYRVLVPGGWCVFWYAMIYWHQLVLDKLREAGFTTFGVPAIWYKPNGPGQTQRPDLILGSCWEPFFYARKGMGTLYSPGQSNLFPFNVIASENKIHPTERPIELMAALLDIFSPPGGRVLVPFAGSGNTLLACSNTGRKCLGYDLSESYKTNFAGRVLKGKVGQFLSYRIKGA